MRVWTVTLFEGGNGQILGVFDSEAKAAERKAQHIKSSVEATREWWGKPPVVFMSGRPAGWSGTLEQAMESARKRAASECEIEAHDVL